MNLKSVFFTTAYLSYVRGDVAGFAPQIADDLVFVKKVAKPYVADDTEAVAKVDTISISEAEAITERHVAEVKAEADKKVAAVEERAGDLDQREADLKAREAALADAEAALAKKAAEPSDETKNTPAAEGAGEKTTATKPPKQGTK